MATERWLRQLEEVKKLTMDFIQIRQDKIASCKDPKKIERYQSEITWAANKFKDKMERIQSRLDERERVNFDTQQFNAVIRCGG